jgi:hypothetical protein
MHFCFESRFPRKNPFKPPMTHFREITQMGRRLTSHLIIATFAAAGLLASGAPAQASGAPAQAAAKRFVNCAALHKKYAHGVGIPGAKDKVRGKTRPVTNFKPDRALYNANKRLDADKDKIACERR